MHFSNSNPICHAFDPEAKDGHDLLIGLNSGDGKHTFSMLDFLLLFLEETVFELLILYASLLGIFKTAITRCWKEACWSPTL